MADYCHSCTFDYFGEEYCWRNDFVHHTLGSETIVGLCEGCGYGEFDRFGRRQPLSEKCPHGHEWAKCRVVVNRDKFYVAYVSALNFHGAGEFIAQFPTGDASSEYIRDYVPTCNTWIDLDRMLTP